MSRFLILLLGLIALSALAFLCINKYSPIIEDDLSSRVTQALELEGFDFVNVGVDGRELFLDGYAPDAAAKEQVEKIALGVIGVRTVKNQLLLDNRLSETEATVVTPTDTQEELTKEADGVHGGANVQVASELESPVDEVTSLYAESHIVQTSINNLTPYKTEFIYEEGKISLQGLVADQSAQVWIVSKAKELFGNENVDDQLKVFYGAPQGWHSTIDTALISLSELGNGHALYLDQKLSITGHTSSLDLSDEFKERIESKLSEDLDLVLNIDVNDSEGINNNLKVKHDSDAKICQKKFDEALKDKQILFDSNEAVIQQKSYKLLNQLATIAKECSKINLEIGGHTDSRGKAEYNQWLSESRAKAVVSYLRKQGVSNKRLSAKGYGELKPLVKNETAEDMSKNRRIEFKVREL